MTENADEQVATKPKFHCKTGSANEHSLTGQSSFNRSGRSTSRGDVFLSRLNVRQDQGHRMKEAARWLLLIVVLAASMSWIGGNFTTKGGIVSSEIEEFPEVSPEDLKQLKTMLRQVSNLTESGSDTVNATRQGPCQCFGGVCGCCSRILYDRWKQKACVNITYDPDEFSFTAHILMNDRVLYTRTVSGKNPRPICVPFPRIPFMRACVRFYNIYFQGRNIHLCVNMEGKFEDTIVFKVSLDCLRFGSNGLALLKPEDGGGLGQVQLFPENPEDEDYDDENEDNEEDDDNDDNDDDDDDDLF